MGEIDMVIATCKHRLEQLTRPSFDRATVEQLLAEIFRLKSEAHQNQIAKELAWRDSKIDEQQEELDELGDEIEGLRQTVDMQRQRIEMLLDANTALAKRLSGMGHPDMVGIQEPKLPLSNRVLPMRPSEADFDAAVRGSASRGLPLSSSLAGASIRPLPDRAERLMDEMRAAVEEVSQLKALPGIDLAGRDLVLTDEGLAVIKGSQTRAKR